MDPLSVTASLLAVIGAAKAVTNGVRKLNSYHKAPREVADLLSELENFQEILNDTRLFAELHPDAVFSEALYVSVQHSASKIAAINDLLASTPFKLSKLNDDNRARLVWVRYKPTLVSLRDDLQVLRMDLAVRIGLVKALSFCRLEESLSVSIRAQKEISDQLSSIVGMMMTSRSFPNQSTGSTVALTSERGDTEAGCPGINSMLNQGRPDEATSGRLPSGAPTPSEDRVSQQSITMPSPSRIVTGQQCKALCSCICHMRSIFKSPWILQTIIGRISVQYVGRQSSCNEFYCRRSPESSFKVVYQLPKYITSRYMYMAMQYTLSSAPELLLRVPRMVSWSHLLWNYANNGDLSAIQKLFAEGRASPYDVNPQGSNALTYTVHGNDCRVALFLLEQGADIDHPNEIERTPSDLLWEYSFTGNCGRDIVSSILRGSGHVQTQSFSTLHKVILGIVPRDLEHELETSTALINVGDSKNRTPLCWATIRNDIQAVRTLLAFGANPNVVDRWGHTPLNFARRVDICKMLLDAGVNIRAPNSDYGRSALHQLFKLTGGCSVGSDTVGMIDLLVNAGIDVDVRDSDGETPLLNAIFSGHTLHVRRLLELGANPNAFNKSSRESALHFAVTFDRHDMIKPLLERDADYTAVNAYGKTVAHIAALYAGTKTISVLADSNLVRLDIALRCKDGKTAADYLSERSILTESEQGLHAEFERFLISIPISKVDRDSEILKAAAVDESSDACYDLRLPGAYPVSADRSTFH